jgi:type I restriction enzyme M protein
MEQCNLHTVVRLPAGVFNPYTPIKTNILFFEKSIPTKGVWFFEITITDGRKQYTKTRPITAAEFDKCQQWWNNREKTEDAWYVSLDDIREAQYTLDFRNPSRRDEVIADPDVLLERIIVDVKELAAAADELRSVAHDWRRPE